MNPSDLTGYLCEQCLDAPAVAVVPAPWGGEMGVCATCGGLQPAAPPWPWDAGPDCPQCAAPPGPEADATAYVQHCMVTEHPLRPGPWRIQPGGPQCPPRALLTRWTRPAASGREAGPAATTRPQWPVSATVRSRSRSTTVSTAGRADQQRSD